jgi:hypothetical protein
MLQPVDIASGQVSGVDDLSPAASRVVNWEADESGINRPRPGLAAHSVANAGSTPFLGLVRWREYIVGVTADRYMRVLPDSAPTVLSVVSTSTASTQVTGDKRVVFALGDSYLYAVGGGYIVRWTNVGGAAPEALSGGPRATHVSILGKRLIANDTADPSSLVWSDIGETAWTSFPAENRSNAEARPDPVVAHFETTQELFVFGSETLQVYQVGADPTLPFDLVTTINVGIGAPYAYCRLQGSEFAFLDNDTRVCISDGRSAAPISDAIQKTLRDLDTIDDCWMYREERGQHSLLVVRFETERRTFVYDLKGKKWSEREYYSAPFQTDWPVSAHVYWPKYKYNLFGSTTSGLMRLDETSRQDLGGPLVCERIGGWTDFGTLNYKRAGKLVAMMRRGTAAQGATPGALEVRVQDDDKPWTPWQALSVGAPEDYKQRAETYATASIFTKRRHHVRFSNTEDMSLVSLHDDVDDLGAA